MLRAGYIRGLGWVQLILGVFLIGLMGTITFFAAPSMLSPGQVIEGQVFSGTRGQALFIFGLFGIVIAFGLITLVNGLWQVATGRRNPWLLTIVFVLLALLVVTGSLVYVVV